MLKFVQKKRKNIIYFIEEDILRDGYINNKCIYVSTFLYDLSKL